MSEANIPLVRQLPTTADKIILFGSGGTGKSFSVATALIDAPKSRRLIYIMTERNAIQGLERGLKYYNIDVQSGQLIYVFPKKKEKAFTNLKRAVDTYAKQSKVAALQGNKDSTQNKETYTFLQSILGAFETFKGLDFVTNEEVNIGNVGNLDQDDILVIDGLSPITHEVWNTIVGDKIAISMNDYMPVQHVMYSIFSNLASLDCNVILLAHEKEILDDKGTIIRRAVDFGCGNAISHRLMGCVTDIIHVYMFGKRYLWEGSRDKVDCVSRIIPKETNLEPDFSLYNFFGNIGKYIEK
jgi:hypothetical protein